MTSSRAASAPSLAPSGAGRFRSRRPGVADAVDPGHQHGQRGQRRRYRRPHRARPGVEADRPAVRDRESARRRRHARHLYVAKADPDGYTVLLLTSSQARHVVMHRTLPYDPLRDFTPVVMFGVQPSVLVAAPSKGWKTLADLIAAAKAKPGALNFASAGLGSASHWPPKACALAAGSTVQHIPFRGAGRGVHRGDNRTRRLLLLPIAPALPHIRDGKVVALAVSTPQRAPRLPEVPTVVEAG